MNKGNIVDILILARKMSKEISVEIEGYTSSGDYSFELLDLALDAMNVPEDSTNQGEDGFCRDFWYGKFSELSGSRKSIQEFLDETIEYLNTCDHPEINKSSAKNFN